VAGDFGYDHVTPCAARSRLRLRSAWSCSAPQSAPASAPTSKTQAAPTPPPTPGARSKESKIQNALSAAPRSIGKDATVMDYPDKQGGEMPMLRKGASDWTCLPDDPATPANHPMCMDKNAMAWAEGWMAMKEPKLTGPGIGYMLQGGSTASNSDPFATKPPAGENWLREPPHIMVFPTSKLDPNVYPSDPKSGKPWIMWGGTPYEHLMVPMKLVEEIGSTRGQARRNRSVRAGDLVGRVHCGEMRGWRTPCLRAHGRDRSSSAPPEG
jgi:hypothetical protein